MIVLTSIHFQRQGRLLRKENRGKGITAAFYGDYWDIATDFQQLNWYVTSKRGTLMFDLPEKEDAYPIRKEDWTSCLLFHTNFRVAQTEWYNQLGIQAKENLNALKQII